jgi:hypothetical protein
VIVETVIPRTEAGRALLDLLYNEDETATFTAHQVVAAILAIEQESAASERLRLVERIRDELMHADGFRPDGKRRVNAYNDDISAILDALASESDR